MRYWRPTLLFCTTLFLYACSSVGTYKVKRGDTLSLIAERHNMSTAQLARMNNISNPNLIKVGEVLRVKGGSKGSSVRDPRRSSSSSGGIARRDSGPVGKAGENAPAYQDTGSTSVKGWVRPTSGTVVKQYNPNVPGQKGIQIAGSPNQRINAANNGEVVFAGQGNSGYGQLVIIKHNSNTYSAYGYLSSVTVREGQRVRKGDQIATMGTSVDGRTVLYFEIRAGGKTLNPERYI